MSHQLALDWMADPQGNPPDYDPDLAFYVRDVIRDGSHWDGHVLGETSDGPMSREEAGLAADVLNASNEDQEIRFEVICDVSAAERAQASVRKSNERSASC